MHEPHMPVAKKVSREVCRQCKNGRHGSCFKRDCGCRYCNKALEYKPHNA